jgi:hypothetical protein
LNQTTCFVGLWKAWARCRRDEAPEEALKEENAHLKKIGTDRAVDTNNLKEMSRGNL